VYISSTIAQEFALCADPNDARLLRALVLTGNADHLDEYNIAVEATRCPKLWGRCNFSRFGAAGAVASIASRRRRSPPGSSHAACGAEHHQSAVGNRPADNPPPRLRGQRAGTQAHRGGVRLEQGGRRLSQDPSLWPCPRQLDVHLDCHGLQPGSAAQAGGGCGVAMPRICPGPAKPTNRCKSLLEAPFSATGPRVSHGNRQSGSRALRFSGSC
jgi:hypothetical protein